MPGLVGGRNPHVRASAFVAITHLREEILQNQQTACVPSPTSGTPNEFLNVGARCTGSRQCGGRKIHSRRFRAEVFFHDRN